MEVLESGADCCVRGLNRLACVMVLGLHICFIFLCVYLVFGSSTALFHLIPELGFQTFIIRQILRRIDIHSFLSLSLRSLVFHFIICISSHVVFIAHIHASPGYYQCHLHFTVTYHLHPAESDCSIHTKSPRTHAASRIAFRRMHA